MNTEVLIIGGGVIGLTIARELRKKGVGRVTVVDRGPLGGEASWAAAGMLAPNIEVDHVDDFHRFCTESLALYPGFAESLMDETGIDIELDRNGTLYVAFSETDVVELRARLERQRHAHLAIEHLPAAEIISAEPLVSRNVLEGLVFPDDWQVENRKLLVALQKFCEVGKVEILERTNVVELLTDGRRVTGARTSAGDIRSDTTVLATGAWTSLIQIGGVNMPLDVRPVRGQMIGFETRTRALRRVVFSPRGYLVPRSDGRILVGATVEDVGFEKGTTIEGIASLATAASEIVPTLRALPIADRWSGLRPLASDPLPIIGGLPGYENIFVATAHYRNGILLAPKTAEIVADQIVDRIDSEFLHLFAAERFTAAGAAAR